MTPSRHRAVIAGESSVLPIERRPVSGPVAVLPEPREPFPSAVAAGGGVLAGIDEHTRGLVWLDNARPDALHDLLKAHPGISWVQLPWAGVDAFADVIRNHGDLLWTSAKGCFAQPVAEHALMLTLGLTRYLPRRVRAQSWDDAPLGVSLFRRRVVIVGAGGIAIELLRLLEPFEVHATVVRRGTDPVPGAENTVPVAELDSVLPEADVVVLAAALTDETRGLFDAARIARMRGSAYLVNVGRGGLVDTDALVAALHDGTIAGAGLDVTDPEPLPAGHPLWDAPGVIITPHMADTPEMTAPLLAERIRENVEAFTSTGRFIGVIDPELGY